MLGSSRGRVKFRSYGYNGTNLIFPVLLRISRIDLGETRSPTTPGQFPGFDDEFNEVVRLPNGQSQLRFHPDVYVLGQYVPPGATERSNRLDPGINTLDYSFRQEYVLSVKDLTEKGLFDVTTARCLLQPGDRLRGIYEVETQTLLDTLNQAELAIQEIHPRFPGHKTLYYCSFEDIGRGSKITS